MLKECPYQLFCAKEIELILKTECSLYKTYAVRTLSINGNLSESCRPIELDGTFKMKFGYHDCGVTESRYLFVFCRKYQK
jgi:hypothetical protein